MSVIKNEDLVLEVSTHIDPSIWDGGKYDAFVDELCGDREFQKAAIFDTLRFLAGGKYQNLRELAQENYDKNPKVQETYGSWSALEGQLQFPQMLSCTLDLATGTGKSYVLYGIAVIMLAEGLVDRVLTLCPSNTIERGLTDKFKELATSADLQDAMPSDRVYASPQIINGTESITDGTICIENYHAVLKHVKSSVRDSLRGRGVRTLVLNDETHHVYAKSAESRKWKEFIADKEFGFQRVVGVSGTCYRKNDYFPDVISRYSLRQAIEEGTVKNVEYVADSPRLDDPDEKWQLIYQEFVHQTQNLKRDKRIRPLSIIVTDTINRCNNVADELRGVLQDTEKITPEQAKQKVLVVTSDKKHERNVALLNTVDSPQSKVEWIVSVSMLTEGWDVKNVFLIVPHEERAFNSKLLIAQVLGRGLRIPDHWNGKQPVVTVFNHHAWATGITKLVNEVLDIEQRISSRPLPDSNYHFELHHLEYTKDPKSTETTISDMINLFERGYIDLPSAEGQESVEIEYDRVRGRGRRETMTLRHKTFTADEVARHIHRRLENFDHDSGRNTTYAIKHPKDDLVHVVKLSAERAGINPDAIPDSSRQKLLQAAGSIARKTGRRVAYKTAPVSLLPPKSTKNRPSDSCSAAELHRGKSIFLHSECLKHLPLEQQEFHHALLDRDGDFSGKVVISKNDFNFKTPFTVAIADSGPERKFIRELCHPQNAKNVDGWVKNTATGFYSIEYAWSKTSTRKTGGAPHVKRGNFNPDFFIKQGNWIFVVEIKDETQLREPSDENIKKYEYAADHFYLLNNWLADSGVEFFYQFHMLVPDDYTLFFEKLKTFNLLRYKSVLDAVMSEHINLKHSVEPRLEAYASVRLVTDAYTDMGLRKGEIGTIVDVLSFPRPGYTVEFHKIPPSSHEKVKTFESNEIEAIK